MCIPPKKSRAGRFNFCVSCVFLSFAPQKQKRFLTPLTSYLWRPNVSIWWIAGSCSILHTHCFWDLSEMSTSFCLLTSVLVTRTTTLLSRLIIWTLNSQSQQRHQGNTLRVRAHFYHWHATKVVSLNCHKRNFKYLGFELTTHVLVFLVVL